MTKRAFTLVELLVVTGIIAAMATVSVGSYFAVVRGMADRGAIAAATSVISLAQERAQIDLSPTVVYFYNELVQNKNDSEGTELVVAGNAIAVRRTGRVSRVNGNLIGDEFADLETTYGIADPSDVTKGDTFRLYQFNFSAMRYSSVYTETEEDAIDNEKFLIEHPANRNFKKSDGDKEDENAILSYAFHIKSGNASWRVGDSYGFEFAHIRLPDNYIFGSSGDIPSKSQPIKELGTVIKCYPDSTASSLDTIKIYAKRPNGWKSIGDTKSEMKDI